MPTRIACLYVPEFALAARLRSEPALRDEPLALVEGKGSHAVVIAAVAAVTNMGVRSGFSLPQTRALLPSVAFKQRDVEAERAAQAALVEAAEAFSPRVEESGPGLVYLDMCNEKSESMLLELAVRRARVAGLRIQAGVAGGKLAARVAAEEALRGPIVVPVEEEGAFLAPLPLERLQGPQTTWSVRLRSDQKLLEIFGRWGLKTIGAFAGLPEREVMARLGKEGWDLHRAARGIDPRPLVARAHPADFTEGIELEWPVPDWKAFEQVARGLLGRLMVRLAAVDLAARALRMSLTIDPVGVDARFVPLPAPSRDVASMLSLLAIELERTPLAGPIVGVTFTADAEKPARAQLSLFDPPALSPDALGATLARLAALVGPDRFGSPRAVEGHRPEGFSLKPFTPPAPDQRNLFATSKEEAAPPSPGAIAVRVLRPRIDIEVGTSREETGKPVFVRTRTNDGWSAEIVGAVRVASGPWRMEDGWWLGEPLVRDYWDVELSDGALYRIYHDPGKGRWWADGIYD